eukprot:9343592-Ditylum_brightwellii.AAC.1
MLTKNPQFLSFVVLAEGIPATQHASNFWFLVTMLAMDDDLDILMSILGLALPRGEFFYDDNDTAFPSPTTPSKYSLKNIDLSKSHKDVDIIYFPSDGFLCLCHIRMSQIKFARSTCVQ